MAPAEEDEKKAEGWIVSYADLMTLLFATFVVLYGLKPEGEQKNVLGVTSNIRESFIEIPDEIPKDERKGPIKSGKRAYQHFKGDLISPPIIQKYRRTTNAINVIDDDVDQLKALVKELNGNKSDRPDVNPTNKAVEVITTNNEIKLRIMANVMFNPGDVRPKESVIPKLARIGQTLKSMDRDFVIEGHTDSSLPTNGVTNWDISIGRASYLARFFETQVGVPKTHISAAGYADTRPIAPNSSDSGRALNRRVEIKIKYEAH